MDRARVLRADLARATNASDSSVSCYLIGQTFPPRWWRTLAYAYLIWRGVGVSAEDMGLSRYGDAELSRLTDATTRENRERWKQWLTRERTRNRV